MDRLTREDTLRPPTIGGLKAKVKSTPGQVLTHSHSCPVGVLFDVQDREELAMARGWLKNQYNDIKGHLKWGLLGLVWTVVVWAMRHLLNLIPHLQPWLVWTIIFITAALVFFLTASKIKNSSGLQSTQTTSGVLTAAYPPFDLNSWLKNSYNSVLLPEIEDRFRALTAHANPSNREEFYFKLITVGLIVFTYEEVWSHIYRSQVLLLLGLNRGPLSVVKAREYYDKAVSDPANNIYPEYLFGPWLAFLQRNLLIFQHPSDMIEITPRGRDFLKYLVHKGFSSDDRRY